MNKENHDQEIFKEFQDFLKSNTIPPNSVSQSLFSRISLDLNPSFWLVFLKLGTIQLTVGAFSLLFCPQLGVGPFFGEYGLMYVFMRFGAVACTAACAAIFFGLSMLLGLLLIRPEEFRVARQIQLIHIPALSTVSLMLLMMVGGDGTLLFYSVWFFGALLGGKLSTQLVVHTRQAKYKLGS